MIASTVQVLLLLGILQVAACDTNSSAINSSQTISFPSSKPTNAVQVPPDFVGFGWDGEFLNNYNNPFSEHLVKSVQDRMGAKTVIRIGGTSSDRVTYNPQQSQAVQCNKTAKNGDQCPYGPETTWTAGPKYFEGFKAFNNSLMTFQAPMSANTDYDASAQFVKLAYEALGAERIQAIALGNEVENYAHTPEAYNDMAKKLEDKIISVLGLKSDQTRIFEVLDLGSGSMTALRLNETKKAWPLSAAFQDGLNSNNNVKQAAAHWYQIEGHEGHEGPHNLQDSLMSHTAITTKGRPYITATTYLLQHSPSIPFMLTETAGQIGGSAPDLGPTFGSTLWSVDWQLYCMSRSIARIAATMRPNAPHSLWIPDANVTAQGQRGQAVRAPYYAQVFVADFVGSSTTGASVLEWEGQEDRFTAYAAYEAGRLVRIGLVDLSEWSPSNGTRPARSVSIPVGRGQSVRVARLAAEQGAYSGGIDFNGMNITYAGQQWSKKVDDGVGHPLKPVFETPGVEGGAVSVELRASEAVIVHLDS